MTDTALTTDDIDNLARALISLTHELWVVKDRQRVLEATLVEAGITAPDSVDTYVPDESLAELLATERKQLLTHVIGSLHNTPS